MENRMYGSRGLLVARATILAGLSLALTRAMAGAQDAGVSELSGSVGEVVGDVAGGDPTGGHQEATGGLPATGLDVLPLAIGGAALLLLGALGMRRYSERGPLGARSMFARR
jgi:hypothetical protein